MEYEVVQREGLDAEGAGFVYADLAAIRSVRDADDSAVIMRGTFDQGLVGHSVQREMPAQVGDIARKWLDRNHVARRAHEDRGEQRVKAHVSADVVDDVTCRYTALEQPLLRVFIAPQPTSVSRRSDDPPLATQRPLRNRHRELPGHEPEWPAQELARRAS